MESPKVPGHAAVPTGDTFTPSFCPAWTRDVVVVEECISNLLFCRARPVVFAG